MKLTEQNRKGPWVFSLNFPEFVWNSFLPRGDSPFIERLRSDCFQRVRNIAPISAHKKSTILLPGGICVCVCMWCAKFTEFVMISRCTMKKIDQFIRDMWGLEYLRWSNKVTGNLPNLKVIGYPHIHKNKINIYISSHFKVWLTVLLLQKSLLTLMNEWSSKSFGSPGKLILNTSLLEGQWFLYLVL